MNTKTVAEYNLKINTILDDAQKELNSFKSSFQSLWQGSQPPKNLLKKYEDLKVRLASLQEISKKGMVDSSDLSQATSDYKEFQKIVRGLSIEFKLFTEEQKRALIDSNIQASFKARTQAVNDYTLSIKKNNEALKQKETLEKNLDKEKKNLQLQSTAKNDAYFRMERLKSSGPAALTKEAEQFVKNQKEALEITKEIASLESTIKAEESKGVKDTGKNKLSRAKSTLEEKRKQLSNLDLETGKDDYSAALSKHNEILKQAEQEWKNYSSAVENSESKIKKIENQLNNLKFTDTSAEFKKLKETLKDLGVEGLESAENIEEIKKVLKSLEQEALAQIDKSLLATISHIEDMSTSGRHLKKAIDEGSESIKQQNQALADQAALESRIKAFFGLQGATQLFRTALRDAIATISELDSTMTEMAVVTDLSVGDYWDQLPEYSKRASELGVSINSAYKAATLYYQQGLKTNEVNAISVETLKMAKIANLDAAEATDKMTAALRGFNMELNETSAQRVSDVYSELAAITAADTKEIANAMTKTASIAYSAGMEFETTAAFLSQIIETTRESAETAGTAMKTVIARFQELKKAPDEIGEVDGEIVDANAIEGALRSVGVSLRDASGQFRELDDVFMELSKKWDSLDKNTQRYIATIAAGSRQQSRFIAMMQDYNRTQELVNAANNSNGASNRQFQKTVESLEAKVEKLKNAWHEFTMGIMNSDFVKFGIDVLTKFLEVINKVTQGFGSFTGSISKIGGVLAIFKIGKALFEKMKGPLVRFFVDVVEGSRQAAIDATKAFSEAAEQEAKKQSSQQPSTSKEQVAFGVGVGGTGKIARTDYGGPGIKNNVANMGIGLLNKTGAGGIVTGISQLSEAKQARKGLEKYKGVSKEQLQANVEAANKQMEEAQNIGKKGGKRSPEKGGKKKAIDKASAAQKKANEELEEYNDLTKKVEENSQQGWNSITSGIEQASTALVAGGIAVGMLGQAFTDAGAEGFGEALSGVGTVMTFLGSVMGVVVPLINLMKPAFAGAGAAGVISGEASTAAWGIFGIIVMAVMAAILVTVAIVLLVLKAINDASPEKKLEKANESAQAASEAADEAAESYNNLVDALDKLDGKYKALEDLTRGTKEWNEAVRDINSSVLELISEYPELAKLVERKEGVLYIDVNDEAVQGVMKEAEERKILAANDAMMAKAQVSQTALSLKVEELADGGVDLLTNAQEGAIWANSIGSTAEKYGKSGFIAGTAVTGGDIGSGIATSFATTIAGAIVGATEGPSKVLEANQKRMEDVAEKIASGELEGEAEIRDYIEKAGYAFGDNAIAMASNLASNAKEVTDFGNAVAAAKEQQMAAFDAIAMSAQSLANTLTFSEEQIKASENLVDGDIVKTFYNEMYDKVANEDFVGWDINDYDGEYRDEMLNALRKKHGDSVRLGEDGEVHFRGEDGSDKTATYTNEEIARLIATEYATEQSKMAIEGVPKALNELSKQLIQLNGGIEAAGSSEISSSVSKMFLSERGGQLTRKDINVLNNSLGEAGTDFIKDWGNKTESEKANYESNGQIPQSIQAMWDNMDDTIKATYGNKITNLIDKYAEAVNGATKALDEAKDVNFDFVTGEIATDLQTKYNQVFDNLGGGQEKKDLAINAIDNFLGKEGLTENTMSSALTLIKDADWSNLESLLALEIKLQNELGFTEEQTRELTTSLANAAFATSNLLTTVDVFGDAWKATEKLNQSLKRMAVLQWEYNRALEDGVLTEGVITKQLGELQNQAKLYEDQYNASVTNLEIKYAAGKFDYGNVDLTKFVTLGENGIDVDQSGISEAVRSGEVSQDSIDKFITSLQEEYDIQNDSLENLRNTVDNIKELEYESKEAYYELRDMAKNAILDSLQKQIDLQQEGLDATKQANDNLINKLQEQIDLDRQRDANEETEKNIANLYNQQAYLSMSTGGSGLETLELNEEIQNAEKDYQNTLIDQSIQRLQDDNQKAQEQRERQINLAQSQLDAYTRSLEFQTHIDQELEEMLAGGTDWLNSDLGQLLQEQLTGLSPQEIADWQKDTGKLVTQASTYLNTDWEDAEKLTRERIETIDINIQNLPKDITKQAGERAITNESTALSRQGFNLSSLGITEKEGTVTFDDTISDTTRQSGLSNLKKVSTADSDKTKIKSLQSQITGKKNLANEYGKTEQADKFNYLDQQEFYDKYSADFADDGFATIKINGSEYTISSYTDYLNIINSHEVEGVTNLSPREAFGGIAVEGSKKWLGEWSTGEDFDATVNGHEDTEVELGGKVTSKSAIARLDEIWDKTGSENKPYVVLSTDSGLSEDMLYIRQGVSNWWIVRDEDADTDTGENRPSGLISAGLDALTAEDDKKQYTKFKYKTGGLADFTGPAWLDGTPSKPEYILNAAQTERFFSLVNILEGFDKQDTSNKSTGDNYFDINIQVEKLESDYDVEQVADKIRKMIYEDASYRNVNAINLIR